MPPRAPFGGLGFGIESKGDEAAAKLLRGLGKSAADPRPAFQQIADELRLGEAAWFASDGRGEWPHLAEATVAYKQREGMPSQPLVRTGALLRSLTAQRGASSRRTVTAKQMRFGTRVPYAVFHQEGRGVPLRRVLVPVDLRTRRRMVADVRDYLMKGTKKQ